MGKAKDITGVVLAGGRSSRFGTNKALALYRGKFLIQHARDTLAAVFPSFVLVTNTPEQFAFLNMAMTSDRFRDMGPLAGIQAGLLQAGTPWIFVLGCDMPAVTPALVTFLCSMARDEYDAVIPWLQTGPEPLCSLYHRTALPIIERQLKNGKPQLQELLGKISVRKVNEEELQDVVGGLEVFANINRRQDLERLR